MSRADDLHQVAGGHSWKCACADCVAWANALDDATRKSTYLAHPDTCACAVCLVHEGRA